MTNLSNVTLGTLAAMLAFIAGILTNLERIQAWLPPTQTAMEKQKADLMEAMRKEQAADAERRRDLLWFIARNRRDILLNQEKPIDEAERHRHYRGIEAAQKYMESLATDRVNTMIFR